MTVQDGMEIADVPPGERTPLERILEESFEGLYLRHSKGILRDVETVRAAISLGEPWGLIMVRTLDAGTGYVYYIAVARAHREKGVGRVLLADALGRFKAAGIGEVFASVEQENLPSQHLFAAEGFSRTTFGEVSKRHGSFHALNMYRMMMVVPGEVLLHKVLD